MKTKTTITQEFGIGEIAVEYSRPSKKGRDIFGTDALVPYGKIWRTGANQAMKVTFSDDVTVEGKDLKAGSYAVLTIFAVNIKQLKNYENLLS